MKAFIEFRPELRNTIKQGAKSDISLCWTCGSCDFECPVNIAAGRLRPQKIVRMANLGLLDELFCLPEVWYCLTCRRCAHVCPNAVKPSAIIEYVRLEMISRGLVSWDTFQQYRKLFTCLQRVRWLAVEECLRGRTLEMDERRWYEWLQTPMHKAFMKIVPGKADRYKGKKLEFINQARPTECFTCGECSGTCPIASGRDVFDPRSIFRMVQLGLYEELLHSPSIWLCLQCGR